MPVDSDSKHLEKLNKDLREGFLAPSNFETIDFAFYDFVNERMNLNTRTNKGWKKTPIIWSSPERVYFSKKNKDMFDLDGTLIYPIVSVQRISMNKSLTRKGIFYGAAPLRTDPLRGGGRLAISKRIVGDKTNNFAVASNIKTFGNTRRTPGRQSYYPLTEKNKNKKIVIETLSVPIPVYVSMNYEVTLKCNYQEHMNQLLQPFVTLGGHINSFLIERDGHSYETFLKSDFNQEDNISSFDEEERIFQTKVGFEVLGYVIGEGDNEQKPRVTKRENAVEVKIPRESVILANGQEFDPNSGFYRD